MTIYLVLTRRSYEYVVLVRRRPGKLQKCNRRFLEAWKHAVEKNRNPPGFSASLANKRAASTGHSRCVGRPGCLRAVRIEHWWNRKPRDVDVDCVRLKSIGKACLHFGPSSGFSVLLLVYALSGRVSSPAQRTAHCSLLTAHLSAVVMSASEDFSSVDMFPGNMTVYGSCRPVSGL